MVLSVKEFHILVNEYGRTTLNGEEFQHFTNAFEQAKVQTYKWIGDMRAERGRKAKKELNNASRSTKLAKEDKAKSP